MKRSKQEIGTLQVDRYKQLMLKQRDIMIALTGRLNERDETIIGLQYEVPATAQLSQQQKRKGSILCLLRPQAPLRV